MAIPKRYILVVLTHLGFFLVYAIRVNLSVALVAMVAEKTNQTDSRHGNQTSNHTHHNDHQVKS